MKAPAATARAVAARVVAAVVHGRSLDDALDEQFARLPKVLGSERALIQEMSYGTVRWLLRLEPLLQGLLDKPLKEKDDDLRALLLVGLYQLLSMRVAKHAAVKETVEAVRVLKMDWAKGLVNAVLRRALREENAIAARVAADETFACPPWLLARIKEEYPDDWRNIAEALNARPPMTLRVHLGKTTRPAYHEKLAAEGLAAEDLADFEAALRLTTPVPVERLPGFPAGEISVQDAAAQLAAPLLDVRPGMRVLDACSAPGGKAAHVLERTPGAQLSALDIDAQRLMRVRENFSRLGLCGEILAGDATHPANWWDGKPFDRILLDAPCSGTGVIRRHPDIRLHRTPEDIGRLAATQAALLDALWPLLAPGGKLLYVTCSILHEENRRAIEVFLGRTPAAACAPLDHPGLARHAEFDGFGYRLRPTAETDGFYYAVLVGRGGTP